MLTRAPPLNLPHSRFHPFAPLALPFSNAPPLTPPPCDAPARLQAHTPGARSLHDPTRQIAKEGFYRWLSDMV